MTLRLERPMPVDVLPQLWQWLHERPDANFDDTGPRSFDGFACEMRRRIETELTWAAFIEDEPVAAFGVKRVSPDRAMWHGVCVRGSFHGRGVASEAFGLILAGLQAEGIAMVDAYMFADNAPIRRLFERLGAVQQPCGRTTTRRGVTVDVVYYTMSTDGQKGRG